MGAEETTTRPSAPAGRPLTLFLCGDVMLGRGVDQVLPHPGDPELRESWARDARDYVRLARAAHGSVPAPVDFDWPWGAALDVLAEVAPAVRVVNLETAVTRSSDFASRKAVHYRMHPDNLPSLAAGEPDVCVLANNHVLDFGTRGLLETLQELGRAGLRWAGAGRDEGEATRPAAVDLPGGPRVVVHAVGSRSSGIPKGWAAARDRPGIALLPDLKDRTADAVLARIAATRRPGDLTVVSVHWGSNWGYVVPAEQRRFAHRLVEGGVDLVHGHSSHHPRPLEVYRGRLILYGCGDFIDDYEGIAGHEEYRDDLRLMYFPALDPDSGALLGLRMVLLRARRMRLEPASAADAVWTCAVLRRASVGFGSTLRLGRDGSLVLEVPGS